MDRHTEKYNATMDKDVDDTKLRSQLVMQCSVHMQRW
jgi:hypothetical protein